MENKFCKGAMLACLLLSSLNSPLSAATLPVLIIDGQNKHEFRATTPHLKNVLEETGLFTVDIATSPPKDGDMRQFSPDFNLFRVVVSNYNGERWSQRTEEALVRFVRNGGGFVSVHSANNSFSQWRQYNEMIGVGGWEGRDEYSGPYLRLRNGKWIQEMTPGPAGSHGRQHEFLVEIQDASHPIMVDLPANWLHAKDELYDRLRGPALNVTVLASAFSSKETGGSGEHEPVLMAIQFGSGRVFHTTLGHNNGQDITSQRSVDFITTLQKGVEWAATGRVTQQTPADFPTKKKVSLRE